ncbi:metalloendopeptidase [Nostoc linckia z18]|jgi:hypothetical protein|uniref:Metalloendopeptidase n=2 Tax=Nostoc linckia TaxID=92942 RepID=A0A9Q5Z6R1_NOSLI|nr:DUF3352 domain-containing protein [Nostoc linckia]PHK38342.1 metalloendopeptidase [Nostoc linckia z15]PHK47106.1 metalloendopeptidase [Nostoc linckia z16]PHJ56069.1 metalloendopeptidase [Nostoc linckia z1]PHJ69379.1 metalloendopeptidase [Nostoc linckia z2]PHJ71305.1 metalloendopeptidase [Nostoc linckia z3]
MPESKSKFLIPAVGAAVVIVGSIAAYTFLKGGPSGSSSDALGSAKVVPSTAMMATYITTDPKAWEKLQQFGTPEAQKLVAKSLEDLNKEMFSDSNISYEKDIKPWAGGVMIALLPPNPTKPVQLNLPPSAPTPPPNVQPEPNILVVVGIKDKISALNFANKLKSEKGVKFKESDYQGQKIIETTENGKATYSVVLDNNHLVLAPEKQAVEKAIDTFKGQSSFASKEGASSVFKGVDVKNSLAQIYVPDYAGMVQQLAAANPQATQLPPQTLAQLKQVKSVVAGVGVDDAGVRVKAIANLDPQLIKYQYQSTPGNIVEQIPADTFALVSGNGISRGWETVVEQSKDSPELKQALEQVRGQLKFVNIDLDKDIFGWMNGEFALAAIPSNQGVLASVGFGGALLFDTSDRKTAEATLTKLDTLAKTQKINIANRNIGGKDVTEWQIPQQGALLAHGWLDRDTVFVAVGGPVADAIADRKSESLDKSEAFKAVTASLQKPNSGYFYLDMDKTKTLPVINSLISSEANTILSSIRGFGITATSPDKSTSELEMLLALKPAK